MAQCCKKMWKFLIGLGFAACGASKVAGINAQEKRFADIQWSQSNMKLVGGVQIAGASLLACKKTSKIGAFLLAISSLCLLVSELKKNKKKKAVIDGLGLLAAFSLLRKCR